MMIRVMQTQFSNPEESIHGDCFARVCCSLLDLPLEAVPLFQEMESGVVRSALGIASRTWFTCQGTRHMQSERTRTAD